MDNLILFIKLNCSAESVKHAVSYVEDSFQYDKEHFYYTSTTDTETMTSLLEFVSEDNLVGHQIVFILYRKATDIFIRKMYIGHITKIEQEHSSYQIFYRITGEIVSPLVIDNFMKFSTLDIKKDFEEDSHISIEDSEPLIHQISYAVNCPQDISNQTPVYPKLEREDPLSSLAQRNEYCKRLYNLQDPSTNRGEFNRDYDRILYSKAFRRMVDKAQIFTSSKGDHYRTRMTHTLCVVQIARSIAQRINVNVALTEAIALGHDLGHTPFGHQGERTLDKLSRSHNAGGFKHNYQSVKVASTLEEEYIECPGLDLSIQTLEGMWKHTKIMKHDTPICDLRDYLPVDITDKMIAMLHPENTFCSTIEGQIVGVADEIAQRSHDLDDALSADLLTLEGIKSILTLKKMTALHQEVEQLQNSIATAQEQNHIYISEKELLASRISAQVIGFLIDDVVENFCRTYGEGTPKREEVDEFFAQNLYVDRLMISFSERGKSLNDYLETLVTKQVINSPEVAAFDDKAQRVISALFEFYYNSPRILHQGTLQRIYIEMRKKSNNVIHFQDGDIALVNEEWQRIKNPEASPSFRDIREKHPDVNFSEYNNFNEYLETLEGDEWQEISDYKERCVEEYKMKNRILVRAICDFISGMTDTYAITEFRNLAC